MTDLRWQLDPECPRAWRAQLERAGGGFFHSPPGLQVSAPDGEPVFARLLHGEAVVGVALGAANRCRLGVHASHVYLPTLPAIGCLARRDEALRLLTDALRARDAVEVVMDSFDAPWQPGPAVPAAEAAPRLEYLVPLDDGRPDELARRASEGHRRLVRKGERASWSFRTHVGQEALALLRVVQLAAAGRAESRGDGFAVRVPEVALRSFTAEPGAVWGVSTFAAWGGSEPLAAVLIGWSGRRAFYVLGGSTPEGYRQGAAVWLHWRVMCRLAEHGCDAYNLGGTPAAASDPEHPAHGLFRFKTGFGAAIVPCRGARWTFRSGHLRLHRVARWVAERLSA